MSFPRLTRRFALPNQDFLAKISLLGENYGEGSPERVNQITSTGSGKPSIFIYSKNRPVPDRGRAQRTVRGETHFLVFLG